MRIPRLLTILGPASVLYVLAARASSSTSASPEWLVAVFALAFSLTPAAVLGARPGRRVSALTLMGVCLAIAMASARTSSPFLDRTHDAAWLVAALLMLDLALPRTARPLVRYAALGGFAVASLAAAALSRADLLPPHTFGVVVVAGILAIGALHQVVLVGRGHTVELFQQLRIGVPSLVQFLLFAQRLQVSRSCGSGMRFKDCRRTFQSVGGPTQRWSVILAERDPNLAEHVGDLLQEQLSQFA